MYQQGGVPNVPQPDDAVLWFLLHVVGLPALVVGVAALILSVLSWVGAARIAVRHGRQVISGAGLVVRSRRGLQLVGIIFVQTGLVATTYVIGQLSLAMAWKRSGPPTELPRMLKLIFSYNHWSHGSLLVVQAAVALVFLIDLVCLVADPMRTPLVVLPWLTGGLGGLVAFTGLLVLLMALTHYEYWTLGMAASNGFFALLMFVWSYFFVSSSSRARNLVEFAQA